MGVSSMLRVVVFVGALVASSAWAQISISICGGSNSPAWACTSTGLDPAAGPSGSGGGAEFINSTTWSGSIGTKSGEAIRVCSTSGVCVDFPLDQKKAWPTPTGWTAPTSPEVNPIPPSGADVSPGGSCTSGAPYGFVVSGSTVCGATLTAAAVAAGDVLCAQQIAAGSSWCEYTYAENGAYYAYALEFEFGTSNPNALKQTPSCPDGYALAGAACDLVDAGAVVKPADNLCNVQRAGTSYMFDLNDPDCADASADLNATVGSGTSAASAGDTVLGGALSVALNVDGTSAGLAAKSCTGGYCYGLSNFGVQDTTTGDAPVASFDAGTASGLSQLPSLGGGTGSGGTTVNTCGLPGQPACALDETGTTDSAGAGTAGAALKGSYETLKGQADAAASSGNMSTLGVPMFSAPADATGAVTNPFAGTHTCVNPSITMLGNSVTLDVCGITATLKLILFWALNVMVAMYAWAAFARRREAA